LFQVQHYSPFSACQGSSRTSAFLNIVGICRRRSQPSQGIPHFHDYLIRDVDCLRARMLSVILDFDQPGNVVLNTNDVYRLGSVCDSLKLVAIK